MGGAAGACSIPAQKSQEVPWEKPACGGQLVGETESSCPAAAAAMRVCAESANAVGSRFTRRIPCAGSRRFGTRAGAAGGLQVSACGHGFQSCLAEELFKDAFIQLWMTGRRIRRRAAAQITHMDQACGEGPWALSIKP